MNLRKERNGSDTHLFEAIRYEMEDVYDCEIDNGNELVVVFDVDKYEGDAECLGNEMKRIVENGENIEKLKAVCAEYGLEIKPMYIEDEESVRFLIWKTGDNPDEPKKMSFHIEAETETEVGLKEVWFDPITALWYLEGHRGEGMTSIKELYEATQP